MDQTDRRILALLREDGRRPNVEMARVLGVSEGTIRKRVERLLTSGAVRIRGLVNPRDVGFPWQALIMLDVTLPHLDQVAEALAGMPEARSVSIVTGQHDIVVEAAFADEAHLMSFLSGRVGRLPGVLSSNTAHVLRVVKLSDDWALPDQAAAAA
jgi:Lrp/AsnC family transcriptional regulator for asnA, asnC and gidA